MNQITRAFICLALFSFSVAWAEFKAGVYSDLNVYGLPLKNTEKLGQRTPGGTLRLMTYEAIDLIFPTEFKNGIEVQRAPFVNGIVFESLMRQDLLDPNTVHASISTSIDAIPEQKTYLIHLRNDVRFSDGTLLTASDVVSSWKFQQEEVVGQGLRVLYQNIYGQLEVSAKSTTEVLLRFPDLPLTAQRKALFSFLSIPIVKRNSRTSADISVPNDFIGTGPYVVQSASRKKVTLERRKDYWQNTALYNFDRISIDLYRDFVAAREAVKANEIDFFEEIHLDKEGVLDADLNRLSYRKISVPIPDEFNRHNVLFFNLARPHMSNPVFRKAISLSYEFDLGNSMFFLNRMSRLPSIGAKSLAQPHGKPQPNVTRHLAKDSEDLLGPFEDYGFMSLSRIPEDQRERRQLQIKLLKSAGYEFSNGRLILNGQPVVLTIFMWELTRYRGQIGLFKENLKKIGIDLQIRYLTDDAAMIAELRRQQYDLYPLWIPITRAFRALDKDALSVFYSKNGGAINPSGSQLNYANINSPSIDAIIDKIQDEDYDSMEYRELIDAFLRILSNQLPFIMMGERTEKTYYINKQLCVPLEGSTETLIMTSYFSSRCEGL